MFGTQAVIAVLTAVSGWLSMGIVAVTSADARQRLIALPPLWVLGGLIAIALVIVAAVRPHPRRLAPLALTLLMWLPFMPGHLPAAFLMWEGPIEAGVWTVAAIAIFVSRPAKSPLGKPRQHPGLAPVTAALIAALAYAAGAVALRDQLPIGDEPHYLMMTQSLIKDGDLRIENNHHNRDYASFSSFDLPIHYLTRGRDGQIYSVHAPGVSVLVLPAFALFGYYGGVATVIACVALASAMAWHAAWLLTAQVSAAWMAWAAVFLSTPMFVQAITVFPDAAGALPVMAGVWLLIALDIRRAVSDRALVAVGAALATLPWLHSRFAMLAGGLGLAIALRLWPIAGRRVAVFLAVPVVSAILWFGFFWWIWGSPSPTAPWGSGITSRVEWIPNGVRGLLFDPQAGLLVSAPIFVFAIAGWLWLLRSKPRLAIETALVAVALTLAVAAYEAWWGGKGAPARYLVAALPLFVAPAAWLASRGRSLRLASMYAVAVGVLMLSARILAADGAFTFRPETGENPLFAWLSPSAPAGMRKTPTSSQLSFVERWSDTLSAPSGSSGATIRIEQPLAPALDAERLGDFRVFFMDARAYPEPTGIWTRAGSETTIIVDCDDASRNLGLRLQAGPVQTTAEVTIGGESQSLSFAPRQRQELVIPPAAVGAWTITIRSGQGFRPQDYDPQNKDGRNLGIWMEVF